MLDGWKLIRAAKVEKISNKSDRIFRANRMMVMRISDAIEKCQSSAQNIANSAISCSLHCLDLVKFSETEKEAQIKKY